MKAGPEQLLALCTLFFSLLGTRAFMPSAVNPTVSADKPAATVTDASGTVFTSGPRRCIASASTVADRLVSAIAGPQFLCAVASPEACVRPWCREFQGKKRIKSLDNLSALADLHADLILTTNPGSPARLMRLREADLPVFDLGPATGLESLRSATTALGAVLGRQSRAEAFWRRFSRRMATVADDTRSPRPTALFLGLYGSLLAGGARDTSWHDVIEAAGLTDAASDRVGWPSWTAIDVATRHPDYIVTETNMGALLCAREGVASTPACRHGHVIEIDGDILSDPGLTMLDAAEAIADGIAPLSVTP